MLTALGCWGRADLGSPQQGAQAGRGRSQHVLRCQCPHPSLPPSLPGCLGCLCATVLLSCSSTEGREGTDRGLQTAMASLLSPCSTLNPTQPQHTPCAVPFHYQSRASLSTDQATETKPHSAPKPHQACIRTGTRNAKNSPMAATFIHTYCFAVALLPTQIPAQVRSLQKHIMKLSAL